MKYLLVLLCLFTSSMPLLKAREIVRINPGWYFLLGDPDKEPTGDDVAMADWDLVSLPHTHEIFPNDLAGFKERGRNVGWYRRTIEMPAAWAGKKVFLVFQGAMQTTRVWVNGKSAGEYAVSGYDSFHFDITHLLKKGKNTLAVRVDNTVNPDIPPDFLKTDFIQFGGLYRDVDLVVTDPVHITFPWEAKEAGIRLTLPEISKDQAVLAAETSVRNDSSSEVVVTVRTEVVAADGRKVASFDEEQKIPAQAGATFRGQTAPIMNPQLWSPSNPYRYTVNSIVLVNGAEQDRVSTKFGFRWFEFTKDRGFFLNGEPLKLIGANRHQTWPFIGNAVPDGLHREDAEQLKAMGCNWVRLSHYPHDPEFLDMLDEMGMLALAEGPTWWGAGNEKWMENLRESFRRMIRRDRNHASIVIWNACLNHSGANPSLVAIAKEEDPGRARGQDNVPAVMDFKHGKVSGNGAITIEHTGHTFPVARGERKVGNDANREYEQVKRHWEQTNASYLTPDNVGMAVWAMYDYNTFHNDNDGIARHGVFDLFRLPKYSYWWHKSELTDEPVVHVIRVDDGKACVFSNCEEVRLSQDTGSGYGKTETRKPDEGFALHHPPTHFGVDPAAVGLKAEGLHQGKVVATSEWRKAGEATALSLETARPEIVADGADLSRIIVSARDANGNLVEDSTLPVTFRISGPGQLVGENPAGLRAGQFIILAQSSFQPGTVEVTAEAAGLKPASIKIKTVPPPAGVDLPASVAAAKPTRSNRIVLPPGGVAPEDAWFRIAPKTDVQKNAWIESDPLLMPGEIKDAPVEIRGGEYRIYTGEWTSKPGRVIGGDAVYVRVKSRGGDGETAWAELNIGGTKTRFEVTTPPKKN